MQLDAKTHNELKDTVLEYQKRFSGHTDDNVFVMWFLRAYLTEDEATAARAICGKTSDKSIDAILIDKDAKTVFIVQGKYRKVPGKMSEHRSDVIAFADLAGRVSESEDESFDEFTSNLDGLVAEKLREARIAILKSGFKLALLYVTLGKCSESVVKDSRRVVIKAPCDARIEVIDAPRVFQLYRDFLDGVAPPVPTLDLPMENGANVKVNGILQRYDQKAAIESWVFSMTGDAIADLYRVGGLRLFARNIRGFLGENTPVNKEMARTLQNEPHRFFYYNNGVTIVCDHAEKRSYRGTDILQVSNPQVINGQQTTRTLAAYRTEASKATVLVKVIQVPRDSKGSVEHFEALVSQIVAGTNWQNAIKASDLMANDRIQIGIERELRKHGYVYIRKRQTKTEIARMTAGQFHKIIRKEELAQAIAACELGAVDARTQKEELFEENNYYRIFRNDRASFYLPRYWLMVITKSSAHGDDIRNEARWLVLNIMWSYIRDYLKTTTAARTFEVLCRTDDAMLFTPMNRLAKLVFAETKKFYRSQSVVDRHRIDASKFFKSKRASEDKFAEFWRSEVNSTVKNRIQNSVNEISEAIASFDG